MEKKRIYYFGFYRDYSLKERPIICQVVESIDCFSCELLGGKYPIREESLPRDELKRYANLLAFTYKAKYIEINGGRRILVK